MAQSTKVRFFVNRALLCTLPSTARATLTLPLPQWPLLPPIQPSPQSPSLIYTQLQQLPFFKPFCSYSLPETNSNKKTINTKVNFSPSDSDSDSDSDDEIDKPVEKPKLPPPYNPFSKTPAIEEPEDPKDLQQIFHKMRSGGLFNHAVKMFDALSKDGLTHEALELFSQIKDRGHMPDVVAHTAVIEAYANAGGHSKDALKAYLRMLAAGVGPNAYTYAVLIKGLASDGKLGEARKYMLEMMGKGMKPNAGTYCAVFEGFVMGEKVEEARELRKEMEELGFLADEKGVREALSCKRGQVFRTVISVLFDK